MKTPTKGVLAILILGIALLLVALVGRLAGAHETSPCHTVVNCKPGGPR